MSATPLPRWLGVGILLVIALSFAGNHVAARIAFDHGANVPTAVAVRSAVTALFVTLLLRWSGATIRLPAPTLWRALVVGLLVSIQSLCLYSAVARIPVALALLAFNTFPLMLALISWAAGGERPSRRAAIAMPLALTGLALALDVAGVARSAAGPGAAQVSMGAGVAFALCGAASFATALHLTTQWLGTTDGRLRTLVIMVVATVVALAGGASGGSFALPRDPTGWAALALLTVLYGSAITALFVVLPRIGAVNNAAVLNAEPILALLLAWVVLDQRVAAIQVAGAFVVIGAIVMLTTGRR